MRSILLLICVVAFTSSSAQFDVKKHLQKKQAEKVKKEKSLFPLFKNCWGSPKFPTSTWKKRLILPNRDIISPNLTYNMPVVTTDMKRLKIMPNASEDYFVKNFYFPGQRKYNDIPNGADEMTLPNKLQELLEKYRSR